MNPRGNQPLIVREPGDLAERVHRSVLGPPIRGLASRGSGISWRRAGSPPPAPPHVKRRIVCDHVREFAPTYFVETGTFRGDTLAHVRGEVRRSISIELDETLSALARRRFRHHADVEILWGDSGQLLPEVLASLREPAALWLDGHYSGGPTAGADDDAPILRELNAALTCDVDHLVLIDDARLFDGSDGYPTLDRIMGLVESFRPLRPAEVNDDIISSHP